MTVTKYPSIQVDGFGFVPGDYRQVVRRYTITNRNNATVRLISLGAGIQSVKVPNNNNDLADVILGFDDLSGYLQNRYIGRIINRSYDPFARTSPATNCSVNIDDSSNTDIVNWDSYVSDNRVVMTRVSSIENGYLMIQVSYGPWSNENRLHVEIRATSTRPVAVDIVSYCLFNLAGHGMGPRELKSHVVAINANKRLELEGDVAGKVDAVNELRSPTRLCSRLLFQVPGGGYNHNFCVIDYSSAWSYRFHARILHPASGRFLEVYSNHPTVRLYTGNHLPDPEKINVTELDKKCKKNTISKHTRGLMGKDGALYTRHGCFALVPQGYPESLSCQNCPSNILYPGKIYVHDLSYDFGVAI